MGAMPWYMTPHGPHHVVEPGTIDEYERRDYTELTAQQVVDFYAGSANFPAYSYATEAEVLGIVASAVTVGTGSVPDALRAAYGTRQYGVTGGRRLMARRGGATADGSLVSTPAGAFAGTAVPLARNIATSGLQFTGANSITIPSGATPQWYRITAQIRVETGAAGERSLQVKVNGAGAPVVSKSNYGSGTFSPDVNGEVFLYPGDVVTLELYTTQATNIVNRGGENDILLSVSALDRAPIQHIPVGYSGPVSDRPGLRRDITGTWMSRDSWAGMAAGDYLSAPEGEYARWLAAPGNLAKAVDVGVPLIPHNSGPGGEHAAGGRANWNTLLDEAASGTRDATYTAMGGKLAQYGPQTVYARLWWEMNQYPASIDAARFKAAWARAVPLIRSGFAAAARPGQTLKIVYCYMASSSNTMDFYPADETLVDIIAADVYAGIYGTTIPTLPALLRSLRGQLDALAVNGAVHGKPVALGEWGNWAQGTAGATETHGRGDAPEVIDAVMDWAEQNQAAFLVYFDIADGGVGIDLDDTPLSLARLKVRHDAL